LLHLPTPALQSGLLIAGSALTEGGLMIVLTPMKTVAVDPATRRARCGGGTTWGELDAATQAHGLAVTGGFISRTRVAGLTLGGGIGWLVRAAGLTCDNLVSARVVTAVGRVLQVSEAEHPDLFWAIRGGGGNLGVVTEFEFALEPPTYRYKPSDRSACAVWRPNRWRSLRHCCLACHWMAGVRGQTH
jgi:FAD/FMN-containing dehydrogenase